MKKLEDIAKMAIEEISAELDDDKKQQVIPEKTLPKLNSQPEVINVPKDEYISSERIFLQNLKERLCVLFEGLNTDNNELRLNLTIKFLEFLLANVENRLANLPK